MRYRHWSRDWMARPVLSRGRILHTAPCKPLGCMGKAEQRMSPISCKNFYSVSQEHSISLIILLNEKEKITPTPTFDKLDCFHLPLSPLIWTYPFALLQSQHTDVLCIFFPLAVAPSLGASLPGCASLTGALVHTGLHTALCDGHRLRISRHLGHTEHATVPPGSQPSTSSLKRR